MDLLDSVPYLVWLRAQPSDQPGFRLDRNGHLIKFSDYLNKQSPYGWEIDYICFQKDGHNGDVHNLEALNCQVMQAKRSKQKKVEPASIKNATNLLRANWFIDIKNSLSRQLGWGAVKIEAC